MASLDNKTQVRRQSTTVASTGGLLVGVGWGQVVGKLAGPLEHLALFIWAIRVLDFLSQDLGLVSGVRDTD